MLWTEKCIKLEMKSPSLRTNYMTTLSLLLLPLLTALAVDYPISDVRLQDGTAPRSGYVAVETSTDIWKPVCYTDSARLANLICQHLGYVGVPYIDTRSNASYVKSSSLRCNGSSLLEDCKAQVFIGKCEAFFYLTCGAEPMNCVGRCGRASNYYSCGCDNTCMTFGDCCLDISEECPDDFHSYIKHNFTIEKASFENVTKCVTMFSQSQLTATIAQPTKFKMIASCPNSWRDYTTSRKCLSNSTSDLLLLLPVHNNAGVLFKNTYCASCHGTALNEMLLWQLVTTDSNLHVFPPRNIWGSRFEACDINLVFVKSCPAGAIQSAADKCEHFIDPFEFSQLGGVKNENCRKCNNIPLFINTHQPKLRPVTFDVIFGLQSWSTLRSSCRNHGNSAQSLNVENLFQNACPLLEEFTNTEQRNDPLPQSNSHDECVRQFLSEIYPSPIYHVLAPVTSPDDKSISVLLPNVLTAIYLESAINEQLVLPHCSVDLSVSLLVKNTSSCHYHTNDLSSSFLDSDNQSYYNIFSIQCKNSCRIIDQNEAVCRDIICQWEDEFLPTINFHIDNFVDMEITHLHSGAVLTEDQFTLTDSRELHTCSEYLIGGWTRAAFYIQIICGPMSLICIILMVIIHVIFPKLRNIYGFCIIGLLTMLSMALLLFMLTTFSQMVDGLAQVVVALNHYTWLSAFAWMTVISFHVSHTFGSKFVANRMSKTSSKKEMLFYGLFGWGVPLPFFLTGITLHLCDCTSFHYANHWMSSGLLTVLLFAIPAIFLLVVTAVFFVIGIIKLRRRQKPQDPENSRQMSLMHNYLVALRLFFILGIPWVLFIIYIPTRNRYLLPVLTLVNSLQGCFIFVSFVTTRRVRALLREKFNNYWSSTGPRYNKGRPAMQTETGTLDNLTPKMNRVKTPGSGTPPTHRE